MELIFGNDSTVKYIVFSVLLLMVAAFIGIFKLITGSALLGIFALLGLLYYVLRMVGAFVMYPGSSFVSRSDIEMRMSREISARMVIFFNSTHFLHLCVTQKKYVSHQNQYDFVIVIANHIRMMRELLEMFETSLSPRKLKMLNNYRLIEDIVEGKEEDQLSIYDLIHQPRAIDALDEAACVRLRQKFERIEALLRELHAIIQSYSPPSGTCALIKFKILAQNLYEIRFGFYTWRTSLDFDINLVSTSEHDKIESVVIHHELERRFMMQEEDERKADPRKPTVLFCNPNGVFIQFFGYDNQTIRNYLRQGYNVILWNYRGYAQSTGSPSIVKSQLDAFNVYSFYRAKGYNIKVVHGYSIGGAAAIGLFRKLPLEQQDKMSVLIIDRSFSSIGQMSIEFGPALHRLTKMIFLGDNMDLSKQFEGVSCNKLLIWDNEDEVIPDRASVKNRIIKRKSKAGLANAEVDHLNEDNQQPDFQPLTHKLAYTLRQLLQLSDRRSPSETQMCVLKDVQRETSDNSALSSEVHDAAKVDMLIKMINRIDGGGIVLMKEPGELRDKLRRRPELFYHICESYILGMVCYGSYFPLQPILHDHQKIKQNTLLKLQKSMGNLREKYEIEAQQPELLFKKEEGVEQQARNMYYVYYKLFQLVTDYFSEDWFALHGSLLPTNNGHNCNFTREEFNILNRFIQHSLAPEEKREEPQEKREEPQEKREERGEKREEGNQEKII